MVRKQEGGRAGGNFIDAWTDLLREARDRALAADPALHGDALLRASERQAVRLSLDNLSTFRFVREAVARGNLRLHGWYLDIFEGSLDAWNPDTGTFERLGRFSPTPSSHRGLPKKPGPLHLPPRPCPFQARRKMRRRMWTRTLVTR